jgi:hypothetical protein
MDYGVRTLDWGFSPWTMGFVTVKQELPPNNKRI